MLGGSEALRSNRATVASLRRNAPPSAARRAADPDRFFTRPRLVPDGALKDVISPENMQGIKGCTVTVAERDAVWQEVVRQVSDQGCGLGYRATAPPRVSSQAAETVALDAPAPLG